jgi:hypothetical protein
MLKVQFATENVSKREYKRKRGRLEAIPKVLVQFWGVWPLSGEVYTETRTGMTTFLTPHYWVNFGTHLLGLLIQRLNR